MGKEGGTKMTNPIDYWYQKYLQEKKRADNLQSAIEVAEDHAYFAGQEAMREQMIEKAVEWLKAYIHYDDFGGNMEWLVPFENDKCMIQHFKTYMED